MGSCIVVLLFGGGGVRIIRREIKRRNWSRTKGIYLKDLEKKMMLWEGLRERVTGGRLLPSEKTRLLEEGFERERKAAFFLSNNYLNLAGLDLPVFILCFVLSLLKLQSTHNPNPKERKKQSLPNLPIAECGYDDLQDSKDNCSSAAKVNTLSPLPLPPSASSKCQPSPTLPCLHPGLLQSPPSLFSTTANPPSLPGSLF